MSLSITTVRLDAITRLTGKTDAGALIFNSRMTPIAEDEALPCLCVYTTDQDEDAITQGMPRFRGPVKLVVEGTVAQNAHAEGAAADAQIQFELDRLASQIKNALLTDPAWIRQFERVGRVETRHSRDAKSEKRRGTVQVSFYLTIPTVYRPDDVAANAVPFTQVKTSVDMISPSNLPGPGPDGQIDVHTKTVL